MKQALRLVAAGVVLMSGMAGTAMAQTSTLVKDDLFAGTEKFAKGATDVTELTMDPDTLQMVGGKNSTKAHRMVLNVVHTYSYDKPGMYNIADVEEFRNKLNTGEWHCSVHTRDLKHGESTDICNKHRTDGMVETAIITVEPKELTFIHTIKQGGSEGGPGGMSSFGDTFNGSLNGSFNDPGFRAEMAVMQAEMRAEMAAMRPQMQAQMAALAPQLRAQMGAQMGAMAPLHIDIPAIQLNLDSLKNLGEPDRLRSKAPLELRKGTDKTPKPEPHNEP